MFAGHKDFGETDITKPYQSNVTTTLVYKYTPELIDTLFSGGMEHEPETWFLHQWYDIHP